MSEAVVMAPNTRLPAEVLEPVLLYGDLSKLTATQRLQYYQAKCESLGLNPLSQPFAYMILQGKLTLYALKDCKEQLRRLHKVSLTIVDERRQGELYIVRVRASLPDGRTDEDLGYAVVGHLAGDAYGNAVLKAITKAKSRVTLSICGIGIPDESEVDSIPGAIIEPAARPERMPEPLPTPRPPHPPAPLAPPAEPAAPEKPAPSQRARVSKPELLKGIKYHLQRVSGGDPEVLTHLIAHVFGSAFSTVEQVEGLPPVYLRNPLRRLQSLKDGGPPDLESPAAENAQEGTQEAQGSTPETDMTDRTPEEENVEPRPDLFGKSGPFDDGPRGPIPNPPNGRGDPRSEVTLPDAPTIINGYISVPDVEVLESWCLLQGQHAIFVERTLACPRDAQGISLTPSQYHAIVGLVRQVLEQEA